MTGFDKCLNAKEIGEYSGRTVHKLNEELVWTNGDKVVKIPEGFETDLASVPRVPVVYLLWGDRAHREAVLHDYLYRIGSVIKILNEYKTVEKEDADWLFREAMIGQGVSWFVYHPMYLGVRVGGSSSFHRMKVNDTFQLEVRY